MLCSERREADTPFQVEYEHTVSLDYTGEAGDKDKQQGGGTPINTLEGGIMTAVLLQSMIRKNLLLSRLRFYGAVRRKKRIEAARSIDARYPWSLARPLSLEDSSRYYLIGSGPASQQHCHMATGTER